VTERCRRCGTDPFAAGEPRTWWVWSSDEGGVTEHALHLCQPCARDFESERDRAEYVRLSLFG
jgi:hypothetical protein